MRFGNVELTGSAAFLNAVIEPVATDPASPRVGQIWFNTAEEVYKFYDGTAVFPFAKGGDLDNYLRRDGTDPGMTGELVLNSNDQSGAGSDRVAVSTGFLTSQLATKQDVITGAATTITDTDLGADLALVSDSSGKVGVSAVSSAELGYLTGVTSAIQGQIDSKQDDLGYVPVDKAGDNMSGNLAMNSNQVKSLGAPTDANDAVRKVDLDTAIATLNWQDDIVDIQTDNTLDVTGAAEGDRYIVLDTANLNASFGTIAGVEDGDIVEYDGSAFVVAFDVSDVALSPAGTMAYVGSTYATYYRYNGSGWAPFSGLDALVDGTGLIKSGNVIDVNMGAGIVALPSDEVGIDLGTNSGLRLADPTTGEASVLTDAQLTVLLEGGTLNLSADGLSIANGGVTAVEISNSALGNGLAGGDGVTLNAVGGTGITVDGSGINFDETYGDGRYVNLAGDTLTGALILAADPTQALEATTKQYTDAAVTAVQDEIDALELRLDSGYFVYDGTSSADGTHTVNHGIGSQYVNVTVVDASDEVIIPDAITYDNANQLTVTLSQALGIRVICTGAAPAV